MATPDVRVRLSAEGVQEVIAALRKVQAEAGAAERASAKVAGAAPARGFSAGLGELGGAVRSTTRLLGAFGIALSAVKLIGFVSQSVEAADTIGDLSQQVAASVRNLSALAAAGATAGVDLEDLGPGLTGLIKKLGEAENGSSKAAGALRALGLSVRSFRGLDTAESFGLIAQRLGSLEDSAQKTRIALELFGKRGATLIPLLNDISAGGLEAAVERAEELGLIFSDELVASSKALNDNLTLLKRQAQGLSLQFTAGLAPGAVASIEAISEAVSGEAVEAFKNLGRVVGATLRLISFLFVVSHENWRVGVESLQNAWVTFSKVVSAALKGDFVGAARIAGEGLLQQARIIRETQDTLVAAGKRAFSTPDAQAPSGGSGRVPPEDLSEAFRERERLLKASLNAELQLIRAKLKLQSEAEERAFERGLIDVRTLYERRRQVIVEGAAAERAAILKEIALEQGREDTIERTTNLIRLRSELRRNELETAGQLAAEEDRHRKRVLDLAEKVVAAEVRRMEAQGQQHAARMNEIAEQAKELERTFLAMKAPPEVARQKADEFRRPLEARAEFEVQADDLRLELAKLDLEREKIRQKVESGQISEVEGMKKIAALEIQSLDTARARSREILNKALLTGDPKAILEAQQLIVALDAIEVAARQASSTFVALRRSAQDAFGSGLTNALAQVGDGIRTLSDFWLSFVFDVLRGLQQIGAAAVSQQITEAIFGLIPTGAPVKKASGGMVYGPGTGTSDSVPALLSRGEYVVRQRVVARPGVLTALHRLNAGDVSVVVPRFTAGDADLIRLGQQRLRARDLEGESQAYRRRYALGGLVGADVVSIGERGAAGASGRVDGEIRVSVDPGLIIEALETPAGQKAQLRNGQRSRRIYRDMFGR